MLIRPLVLYRTNSFPGQAILLGDTFLRVALVEQSANGSNHCGRKAMALPIGHILRVLVVGSDPHVIGIAASDRPAAIVAGMQDHTVWLIAMD